MAERTTISRPYAEAAFSYAKEKKTLAEWSYLLQLMAAVVKDAAVTALVDDPSGPREKIVEIVSDICADNIDETGVNFIRLLLENGRLLLMPDISVLFDQLKADADGSLEAKVTSAYALTQSQSKAIASGLTKKLGRDVSVVSEVDKSLVGGVVIRAGDLIIDGSVSGYLRELSSQLNQ